MPPRLHPCLLSALHLLLIVGFIGQPVLVASAAPAHPAPVSVLSTQEEPIPPEEAPVTWPIPLADQPVAFDAPPASVPLDGMFPPETLNDPGPSVETPTAPMLPAVPLDLQIETDRELLALGETAVVTLTLFAVPEAAPVQATVSFTLPAGLQILESSAPAFPWSVDTATLAAGATYRLAVTSAAETGSLPAVVELQLGATAPNSNGWQVRQLLGLLPAATVTAAD